MTNCKVIAFRRGVLVRDKAQVCMKDCILDLTTKQPLAAVTGVVCGILSDSNRTLLHHPMLTLVVQLL
jgi:hypothetical protein